MVIYPVTVNIFQSGAKNCTDWSTDTAIHSWRRAACEAKNITVTESAETTCCMKNIPHLLFSFSHTAQIIRSVSNAPPPHNKHEGAAAD